MICLGELISKKFYEPKFYPTCRFFASGLPKREETCTHRFAIKIEFFLFYFDLHEEDANNYARLFILAVLIISTMAVLKLKNVYFLSPQSAVGK